MSKPLALYSPLKVVSKKCWRTYCEKPRWARTTAKAGTGKVIITGMARPDGRRVAPEASIVIEGSADAGIRLRLAFGRQFEDNTLAFAGFEGNGLSEGLVGDDKIRVGDVIGGVVEGEALIFAGIQSTHGEMALPVACDLLVNVVALAATGVGDAHDRDVGDGLAVFVHDVAFDRAALGAGDDFKRG